LLKKKKKIKKREKVKVLGLCFGGADGSLLRIDTIFT
jgi:hypothetical protein